MTQAGGTGILRSIFEKSVRFRLWRSRALGKALWNATPARGALKREVREVKYLGERVVKLAELKVGKWDLRNGEANYDKLRRSVAAHGIIEPLLVRDEGGRLVLLDGHRRYHVAQELGLKEVRVVLVQGSEDELKELIAVRHVTAELYGPLVKARLARLYRNSGMKLEEIAALLGCTKGYVSDLVNIWVLGNGVVRALEEKKIKVGHARLLLRLETARREEILREILDKGLKVAETKALIGGRSVTPWEEFRGALPPGVAATRANDHIELKVRFATLEELRAKLRSVANALKGAGELEAESLPSPV